MKCSPQRRICVFFLQTLHRTLC